MSEKETAAQGSVVLDQKEVASRTLADVIKQSREAFPEEKYWPQLIQDKDVNAQWDIDPSPHTVYVNCDGIGTKPELAERLFDLTKDYRFMETLAFDCAAMVADDAARFGYFVLGVANNLDVNSAKDKEFIAALSRGLFRASKQGRFPILNGETAELGYRSPGYGDTHVNWNMTALTLINRDKLIDGSRLAPGQQVVALREKSIRSNGLSKARAILENAFLKKQSAIAKIGYVGRDIWRKLYNLQTAVEGDTDLSLGIVEKFLDSELGRRLAEHYHLPWHEDFPELTEELLRPSTIYAPLIYEAQGGVDLEPVVPLVACAHISGGGVPLKAQRMLEARGFGLSMGTPFEDPKAVRQLIDLAYENPVKGAPLVNERTACEQWNRGVGFLCVTENSADAAKLIAIAEKLGYEATIAGKIIEERKIKFRGETWNY